MAQAFIGFGGNIGDARQSITDAIVCLAQHIEVHIINKSCFYQSAPVNAVGGDYINAVVEIETDLNPYGLLYVCQSIEQQFGRERPFANAPRTLDLDILFYGDAKLQSTRLTVPHPRWLERAVVLLPLQEVAPQKVVQVMLHAVAHQKIEKLA